MKKPDGIPYCGSLVKADSRDEVIGAASVLAKVSRDSHMVQMDGVYPGYHFDQHKGYGTELHREALKRLGPCPIHRRLFLRRILGGKD